MATADNSYRPEKSKRFGLAVKRLLEEHQLSQREFAKRAGLATDYVSKLVNGEIGEPRNSTVEKLAKGFDITATELWQRVKQMDGATEPVPSVAPKTPQADEPPATPTEAESQTPKKLVVGLDVLRAVPVWVGRDQLLEQLHREFVGTAEEANQPRPIVLALVGQGGIGKTSLAVKLLEAVGVDLRRAALAHQSIYAGVICFRAEEGSSFDEVAGVLLAALGIESVEALKEAEQKIQSMIQGLQQRRYLLVLDNLEVILHPASQPEAGRAVQPEWGQLLNALVHCPHQSQVILTSREVPLDLADRRYPNSEPDPVLVRIERLGGVEVAAGAEILSQRQVQDSETDRRWVAERVEGHVFVLTQLAAVAKGRPGYLRQHPELVTQRAEPILQEQLTRQSEPARELLKRMCVLRVGIDVRGLTFLRLYQEGEESQRFRRAVMFGRSTELTEAEIQETQVLVNRLVDSCLVQCRYDEHKREDVYDLHRLIVEFLQAEYQTELPDLLKRVYSFYRTGKTIDQPKTLEDLRPVLEAQYFAFQLGNYDEASNLIQGDLEECLERWGHWNLLKDLCEQLLPHVDDWDRCWHLRAIGIIYRNFGNWDTAERFFQEALTLDRQAGSKSGMATSWGLLGDIERHRGNWDAAEQLYRQSLHLREELGYRAGMATSWGLLGDIERHRGNWDAAEQLYRQSLHLQEELGYRVGIAASWGLLGDIERHRGNWDAAEQLYRQCLQIEEELGDRAGIAASWGCLGGIEHHRGNRDAAEALYRKSMKLSQELGSTWHLAHNHYDLAQLERQRGNPEQAQAYYNTAHQLFSQLGAAKDLEEIEQEWHTNDSSH
ncbi:tetratricopeptide repeat protein [Pantanalinema sp. GBBB05]|uniref:tetratricopeptide repeat protein n=1 Tax=Pantanalinema sp. GBBB05 TaxID=2604139 RepID=UPI001E127431|nr:tetratricopeptide repeat protein [Pantanalinema sp. GBBB05]